MTEKEIEKLFKRSVIKMREDIGGDRQYDQLRWIFLEAFQLGAKEAQRIYKS